MPRLIRLSCDWDYMVTMLVVKLFCSAGLCMAVSRHQWCGMEACDGMLTAIHAGYHSVDQSVQYLIEALRGWISYFRGIDGWQSGLLSCGYGQHVTPGVTRGTTAQQMRCNQSLDHRLPVLRTLRVRTYSTFCAL